MSTQPKRQYKKPVLRRLGLLRRLTRFTFHPPAEPFGDAPEHPH